MTAQRKVSVPQITAWIGLLSSADAEARKHGALELYAAGRALGDSVVNRWLAADAELGELLSEFVLDISDLELRLKSRNRVVGVAVLPENFRRIRSAMGSPQLAQVPADQDAMEFELHVAGAELDILTTLAPGDRGAIATFLEKFGEGIQQVEYFVSDVDRATQILRERFGLQPIYPQTRAGADSTRVNFFLATTPEGKKVLIELVEIGSPEPAAA